MGPRSRCSYGRQWLLVVVSLCMASSLQGQSPGNSVCTPIPIDKTPAKPVPRLPDTFQTYVELNIVNKQVTVEAYESFDPPNNRSVLRMLRDVRESTSYMDFSTNEVHYVYEHTKCVSIPLDQRDERFMLGKLNINEVTYTYSVVSALKFGQEFGHEYLGQTTIRGIPSDHWRSCQHLHLPEANFTIDSYFAIPEWTQTLGATAMPVRAVVEGLSKHGPTDIHPFKHVYDFLNFQPYADKDARTYQTPDGVYCENRKTTRPVPKLPPAFRFRTEVSQPWSSLKTGIIFNVDFWYDYNRKMGRMDFAFPIPVSFINDYNIGIRYMKNLREGTCQMQPFSTKRVPGNQQLVIDMIDPDKLFFLDDTYVYTGGVMHRGVPCNRFISRKTFGDPATVSFNATLEYCIIDHRYIEIGADATTLVKDVPLTLSWVTKITAGDFASRWNYYDFETLDFHADMTMFDIVDCYNAGLRRNIRIMFDMIYFDIANYKGHFITDVISRIAKVAHMSPLRVQRARLDYDAISTYFTATLLDRVPFNVIFKPNEDGEVVGLVSMDRKVEKVALEQECADMCLDMVDDQGQPIRCNSFAYCFADKNCLLSTSHLQKPGPVGVAQYCQAKYVKYYNRAVPAPELPDVTLMAALGNLKNNVLSGRFKVYFKPHDGDQLKIYTAKTIKTDFTRGDSPGIQTLVKDFKQIPKTAVAAKYLRVVINTGLSLDECAAACERKANFVCQSFVFCGNVGECMLTSEHPGEKTDMLHNTSSCDVYSRNYVQKFKEYKGLSLPQKDAVTLLKVDSTERCAVLCVTQKGFNCKSFDYCRSTSTCRLNKQHMYDIPAREGKLEIMPNCAHFSRKYVDDFKRTNSGQRIPLRGVNLIRDMDVTSCAKTCVENLGNQCKGFDFCGNETYCVISSKSYSEKGVGKVVTQDSAFCSHYTRTGFPDGTSYVPQTINTGYSGGSMAGLAIGMLVVGMLLVVLIVAVVVKARGGSTDNMKTTFMTITNPGYANTH